MVFYPSFCVLPIKEEKKMPKKAPKQKKTAITTPYRKNQIVAEIAEETGLGRQDVTAVFNSLANLMARHLKKNSAGMFNFMGLLKLRSVRKPATKARKGINPFTGEATTFKAKPASTTVKVRALKKLKDLL
jgi:nucleoid DNA-binding protein